MPNLGVMGAGGGGGGATLADLPGLIEGAHQGRGLGRMFLRHLRRTRALLHVVDAAAADPATDYLAVRCVALAAHACMHAGGEGLLHGGRELRQPRHRHHPGTEKKRHAPTPTHNNSACMQCTRTRTHTTRSEELRMYNPDYCARPHVVALNKVDLEDAGERAQGGRGEGELSES